MAKGDASRKRRANARRRTLNLLHDVSGVKSIIQIGLGDWAEGPVLLGLFSPEEVDYFAVEPLQRYHENAIGMGFPGVVLRSVAWSVPHKKFTFTDQRTETNVFEDQEKGFGRVSVESVTLDLIIPQTNLHAPILLWMDCEGSEPYVLEGAKETLASVKYIVCELKDVPRHKDWMPAHKLIHFLGELGFYLLKRDNDGLFVNGR